MKKIIKRMACILILLLSVSATVSANDFFYRVDSRTPDEIKRSKGLLPRGEDDYFERGTNMNINLYDHVVGTPTGAARYDDGYVSTTTSRDRAHFLGQQYISGVDEYYIYVVVPAPNLLPVNDILRQHSPHPDEMEYAALGGIPLSQIYGWYRVYFGRIDDRGLRRNQAYREDLFRGMGTASAHDVYGLAGFPAGHQAWNQRPWADFAPSGCRSVTKRSADNNFIKPCEREVTKSAKQYLENYITRINRKPLFIIAQSLMDSRKQQREEL